MSHQIQAGEFRCILPRKLSKPERRRGAERSLDRNSAQMSCAQAKCAHTINISTDLFSPLFCQESTRLRQHSQIAQLHQTSRLIKLFAVNSGSLINSSASGKFHMLEEFFFFFACFPQLPVQFGFSMQQTKHLYVLMAPSCGVDVHLRTMFVFCFCCFLDKVDTKIDYIF